MVTIISALITTGGLIYIALLNRKIHSLVNQRMTDALDEIRALRLYVDKTAKPNDPPVPPTIVE